MRAIAVGLELVGNLARDGVELIGLGEMGIGNTTAASALTAVPQWRTRRARDRPRHGRRRRRPGLRKVAAIELALAVNAPDPGDPVGVLAAVGGLEIGVLVGVIAGCGRGPDTARARWLHHRRRRAHRRGAGAGDRGPAHRGSPLDGAGARRHPGTARPGPLARAGPAARGGERRRAGDATSVGAAAAIRDGMATFESAAVAGPT